MITGNAMDVYTVVFGNGEKFSLMARDITMARLNAQELVPNSTIIAVHKADQWEEEGDDDHA